MMEVGFVGPPVAGGGNARSPGGRAGPGRMTMSFAPAPTFAYLPHVGEAKLRLRGSSIADILRQAALALADLLLPGPPPRAPERVREIELDAPDRAALLIDWLNELLFLAERDRWLPVRIDVLEATETHLRAVGRGPVLERAPSLIKAATWHQLRFEVRNGGFEAEVLLDI
jgi:SHS2 domain-containing protein